MLSHHGVSWLKLANKRWIGAANLLTNRSRHYHVEAFDQMVDDVNAQAIDHVVCTGDLTNLALEQEFAFARGKFERLAGGPANVTVIPGNHDAYVAEGVGLFARFFDEFYRGDAGFATASTSPGAPSEFDDAARWPFVRIRGELALIGVTSSPATPWFRAYGRVGEAQLARLRAILGDERLRGKVRVVAIHHPPAGKPARNRRRGLRDHDGFARVIAEVGCDLIVHGHEHRDLSEVLPGPSGPVPVRGIASGTYDHGKPHRTARYRVFEVSHGRIVEEQIRVWERETGQFVAQPGPQAPG